MTDYLGNPKVQYFDTNTQEFLAGGKLYTYVAGTTTPIATYPTPADAVALTNANANPVILDTRGEAAIVLSGATKLVLTDALDNIIWTQDGLASISADPAAAVPVGAMISYAGSVAPAGWLECNGSAVSRVTYADLFTAIGTTYGAGDGSTTFNIPDLSRRVLVGRGGTGTATLANTLAATGGAETHTLLTAEIPAHNHLYAIYNAFVTATAGGLGSIWQQLTGNSFATSNTGGGGAHNNMQPSMVTTMIIKSS